MKFVCNVAELDEEKCHPSDTFIPYKGVEIEINTNAIGKLLENDFTPASKINDI